MKNLKLHFGLMRAGLKVSHVYFLRTFSVIGDGKRLRVRPASTQSGPLLVSEDVGAGGVKLASSDDSVSVPSRLVLRLELAKLGRPGREVLWCKRAVSEPEPEKGKSLAPRSRGSSGRLRTTTVA